MKLFKSLLIILVFFSVVYGDEMKIFKIREGKSIELPGTDELLKVEKIKDNYALVRIIYKSGKKEKAEPTKIKPSFRMDISSVATNIYRTVRSCKTDKPLKKEIVLKNTETNCWNNKDYQCKKDNVYYDERCDTQIFPVVEFGYYYTKGWGFTITMLSPEEKTIAITFKNGK